MEEYIKVRRDLVVKMILEAMPEKGRQYMQCVNCGKIFDPNNPELALIDCKEIFGSHFLIQTFYDLGYMKIRGTVCFDCFYKRYIV